MPVRLHVNIDHVATVRNARGTRYPDPLFAAQLCEAAGADGITAHLREDRRHIRDGDVQRLKASLKVPLNLEMAATPAMVEKALAIKPDVVTLVPEKRAERTTEGGLELLGEAQAAVRSAIGQLTGAGIPVSLFIAPDPAQLRAAAQLKVPRVELHTGSYCEATLHHGTAMERDRLSSAELERLAQAAEEGVSLGLHVAAGLAVLDEIADRGLVGNAAVTGARFKAGDRKSVV